VIVERVVFLPGASGDASFWAPVAERLPDHVDIVRLAWPGLGNVPPRPDVRGFDDLLRLTLATIDRDVALVAQSMGGILALQATLERPARVRRLVLAATSGGVDGGDADPISPVAVGQNLASLLPKSHLVVIPGGDHAFARDRAADVAPHILRHLDLDRP
jgi:pimeloyl-ACP methyl ester carboxylesterase